MYQAHGVISACTQQDHCEKTLAEIWRSFSGDKFQIVSIQAIINPSHRLFCSYCG